MVECKAHRVNQFVLNPDPGLPLILVYGPDSGLVSERTEKIIQKYEMDVNDPFSIIQMSAVKISEYPASLIDEAVSIGMFSTKRLIKISVANTNHRNLLPAVKPLFDKSLKDVMILFEAGDLKRDSSLRKAFEKAQNAIALPCYQDNNYSLDQLIDEEIVAHGISVSHDSRILLRSFIGGDRLVSRGELSKLAIYAYGQKEINIEDISAVISDTSALNLNEVIDCAILGDLKTMNRLLQRVILSGIHADQIVLATLKQFQMLHKICSDFDFGHGSIKVLVDSIRPPIHFSRKEKIISALRYWKLDTFTRLITKINDGLLKCRIKPDLSSTTASTILFAIALEARNQFKSQKKS